MIRQVARNWFNTLNEALEAAGVVEHWPVGTNIKYSETVEVISDGVYISVFRENNGLYERPIVYATQCEDRVQHFLHK